MPLRSSIPQNWDINVAEPEQNPNAITFSRKVNRPATPIAATALFPNGTIIAVSISDAHEVSRFCIAIGIASATAVRTKPFGNADLVMDRLLP